MLQLSFAAFSAVIGAGYAAFVLHNFSFSDLDVPIQAAWGAGSPVLL